MAPETIEKAGHSFEVDWWQLGILLYELLSSRTPFFDSSPYVLYSKILTAEVKFPGYFDHPTCLLISSLLSKQPKRRPNEAQIKAHSFFAGVDWGRVSRQQLTPPLINRVKSQEDDTFFEKFREPGQWESVEECFVGF
ncbi:MAG TPA: hypothetical protein DCS88_11070 [Alphaproteobacteria bacterium]|nr:hypothetical protein [Alphaproteobacteria bacterium]